ncbi:hypothetical protein PTKIN_Ptkin05aG0104000 [Pterospermum kingtungense]
MYERDSLWVKVLAAKYVNHEVNVESFQPKQNSLAVWTGRMSDDSAIDGICWSESVSGLSTVKSAYQLVTGDVGNDGNIALKHNMAAAPYQHHTCCHALLLGEKCVLSMSLVTCKLVVV